VNFSIIIPTYNSENTIQKCIESIISSAQFAKVDLEVVVVDNFSVDKTFNIVKELAALHSCVSFSQVGPERSEQRNLGIQISNGDIIGYIDSDMYFGVSLINIISHWFNQNPERQFAKVSETMVGNTLFTKIRRFERALYENTTIDSPRFFRKKVFDEIGMFLPGIPGSEDWELDERVYKYNKGLGELFIQETSIKLKLPNVPEDNFPTIFHDETEISFSVFLKKKNYYLKSNIYIIERLHEYKFIDKNFSVFHRLFKIPILLQNNNFLGKNIALLIGFYGYKIIQIIYVVVNIKLRALKD